MNDIAIIGMSGRFPGAKNIQQYEKNIFSGVESIKPLSDAQLRERGVAETLIKNPNYVKATSTIDDIEHFAAGFFNYSSRESRRIDPQQRLFLECAYEAMENAGYSKVSKDILVGVFAGASSNTYLLDNMQRGRHDFNLDFMDYVEERQGSDKDFLATRVSYKLNLNGPSFTIQSACSTSLVAVHTACQSLLNGESDMVLAGAVAVMYPNNQGYMYKEGSIVSPDGHCRAFSDKAKGTVFGNGVGAVVLKRLDDAQQDRDNILAVIKGSTINNDGGQKPNYTAPSMDRQSQVVSDALEITGISPETIGFIEAHGTGTPLGDPVEVAALTQAYRGYTDKKQFCALGSVKTNIGHLDVAAGIAGLIKTILVLNNKVIPPTLHYERSNPQIDFDNSPFFVNDQTCSFKQTDTPRRAGITSLGVGGTNVHIILEEAPERQLILPAEKKPELVLLSAQTPSELIQMRRDLAEQLQKEKPPLLQDIAFTLKVGRLKYSYGQSFVVSDIEALRCELLDAPPIDVANKERVCSLDCYLPHLTVEQANYFSKLTNTQPGYADIIEQCCSELAIKGLELSSAEPNAWAFSHLYALLGLVSNLDIVPTNIYATGVGQLVALCMKDVLSLRQALDLSISQDKVFDLSYLSLPQNCQFSDSLASLNIHSGSTISIREDTDDLRFPLILGLQNGSFFNLEQQVATAWQNTVAAMWHADVELNFDGELVAESTCRVPLVSYPFTREVYNFVGQDKCSEVQNPPLIQQQLFVPLTGQAIFTCELNFKDFAYFDHHRVYGESIIPGSFHVSMVLSAIKQRFYADNDDAVFGIRELVFAKALFLPKKQSCHVQVVIDGGRVEQFKLEQSRYTLISSKNDTAVIHSQGKLLAAAGKIPKVDISALKECCNEEYDAEQFYQKGWEQGFQWAGDFRSIDQIYKGEGEALVSLKSSSALASSIAQYSVHPAILDACFQSYLAAILNHPELGESSDPFIPLSMDKVVFQCQPQSRLWIHASLNDQQISNDSFSVNIIILNPDGEVVITVDGLRTMRVPQKQMQQLAQEGERDDNLDFVYMPAWQHALPKGSVRQNNGNIVIISTGSTLGLIKNLTADYEVLAPDREILLVSLEEHFSQSDKKITLDHKKPNDYEKLVAQITPDSQVLFITSPIGNTANTDKSEIELFGETQDKGIKSLFYLTKALSKRPPQGMSLQVLTGSVFSVNGTEKKLNPYAGGLGGLIKVFAREVPSINSVCVDICDEDLASTEYRRATLSMIEHERQGENVRSVAVRQGVRYQHQMVKVANLAQLSNEQSIFKNQGVYLILGGAGGIGAALTEYLGERYQARVAWIGRREEDDTIAVAMDQARQKGAEVSYFSADACDLQLMKKIHQEITEEFGTVNGVIHSALVLDDANIGNMSEAAFAAAYDIKTKATVVLDHITRDDKLDFFAVFSSENSIRGWHGLANYVSGCQFKDNYCCYLRGLGIPAYIFNWGFWGETGIAVQARIRTLVEQQGILPMTTAEGIDVFERSLAANLPQIMPIKLSSRINEQLGVLEGKVGLPQMLPPADSRKVYDRVCEHLKNVINLYEEPTDNHPWQQLVNDWVLVRTLAALKSLGLNLCAGKPFIVADIIASKNIISSLEPLFVALENILTRRGALLDGKLIDKVEKLLAKNQEYELARSQLISAYPACESWFVILDTCIDNFVAVVRGDVKATDVLFPQASVHLVEGVYRNNRASDYFNTLVKELVLDTTARMLNSLGSNHCLKDKIRILEFGAGTGATTRALLDELTRYGAEIEYVYTDVSKHFTQLAEQNFGQRYSFMNFATFDMEKPLQSQGFEPGSFDIVLGTNVIHVCKSIHKTLENLKGLLVNKGTLVINELTAINDIWTVTFGLLDGWWLSQDQHLRIADCPLLSPNRWQQILGASGFKNVQTLQQPNIEAFDQAPQSVFVAQSDGKVICPTEIYESNQNLGSDKCNSSKLPVRESSLGKLSFETIAGLALSERTSMLSEYLREQIAAILEVKDSSVIDVDEPVGEMGMDSLIVLSFCNLLSQQMAVTVPTSLVFDYPTINEMVRYLSNDLLGWQIKETEVEVEAERQPIITVDESSLIDKLSLDEIDELELAALLEAELDD